MSLLENTNREANFLIQRLRFLNARAFLVDVNYVKIVQSINEYKFT